MGVLVTASVISQSKHSPHPAEYQIVQVLVSVIDSLCYDPGMTHCHTMSFLHCQWYIHPNSTGAQSVQQLHWCDVAMNRYCQVMGGKLETGAHYLSLLFQQQRACMQHYRRAQRPLGRQVLGVIIQAYRLGPAQGLAQGCTKPWQGVHGFHGTCHSVTFNFMKKRLLMMM